MFLARMAEGRTNGLLDIEALERLFEAGYRWRYKQLIQANQGSMTL